MAPSIAPAGRGAVAWLVAMLLTVSWVVTSPTAALGQASSATQREAQEIARTLKCPVCESQSVADSPSQLAQEMRGYIERRLEAGESRDAILQELIDRYGEGLLLEPPRRGFTLIVWWLPILSLAIGGAAVALTLRRALRRPSSEHAATPAKPTGAAASTQSWEAAVSDGSPVGPELAPEELAHYRERLAEELAQRERGPA